MKIKEIKKRAEAYIEENGIEKNVDQIIKAFVDGAKSESVKTREIASAARTLLSLLDGGAFMNDSDADVDHAENHLNHLICEAND